MKIGGIQYNNYAKSIIARDQAKFAKTPEIKKSAQKTVKNALTDEFVEQIKAHAKKDAQVNVYMQKDYINMVTAHKQQNVSPNRQEAISRAASAMNRAFSKNYTGGVDLLEQLLDGGYSVKAWKGIFTTAEVYAPNGEMIAAYNSQNGQWMNIDTEAECQFMYATNDIYAEAFDAARAEIEAAAQGTASQKQAADTNTAAFDVKV